MDAEGRPWTIVTVPVLGKDVNRMIQTWLCKKDLNKTHQDSLDGTTIGAADALAILCPETCDKLHITHAYTLEIHHVIVR